MGSTEEGVEPHDRVAPPTQPSKDRTALAWRVLRSPGLHGLVGIGLLGWLLIEAIAALGGPEEIRARYGISAGILAVPVQAVVAVSPVPGEIVALANSAVFGFWLGSCFNWLGWMLAAFLEYALVRRVVSDADPTAGLSRMPAWLRRFPADHPLFLILARYLPYGSHAVNSMAGAHRVSLYRFFWTSALALVPGSMLIAAIANGLVSLS